MYNSERPQPETSNADARSEAKTAPEPSIGKTDRNTSNRATNKNSTAPKTANHSIIDIYGDHDIKFHSRTDWHDSIVDVLYRFIKDSINVKVLREQNILHPLDISTRTSPYTERARSDLTFFWKQSIFIVDVNTCGSSNTVFHHFKGSREIITTRTYDADNSLEMHEKKKLQKYLANDDFKKLKEEYEDTPIHIIPFVVDDKGNLGYRAKMFLRQLVGFDPQPGEFPWTASLYLYLNGLRKIAAESVRSAYRDISMRSKKGCFQHEHDRPDLDQATFCTSGEYLGRLLGSLIRRGVTEPLRQSQVLSKVMDKVLTGGAQAHETAPEQTD